MNIQLRKTEECGSEQEIDHIYTTDRIEQQHLRKETKMCYDQTTVAQ